VLISLPQKECETNPSREEKNSAVFPNRVRWKKSQSLTEVTVVRTTNLCHERKNPYS